ncbi:hypothetical protein INR77_09060 [Erythrobacter sp. SCSIO 43205]|nr:hypothetical protein [Erythrobacter sp. SCSIO 43205]UAB76996.1 hypothetical protein INR77_09060 [Erythrobacter sp. SCSIO 43205]
MADRSDTGLCLRPRNVGWLGDNDMNPSTREFAVMFAGVCFVTLCFIAQL